MIRPLLNIPMINIEEPVAEMAVAAGTKIGILGTIPSSPVAMERVIREKPLKLARKWKSWLPMPLVLRESICNRDKHDEMVCERLYKLAEEVTASPSLKFP